MKITNIFKPLDVYKTNKVNASKIQKGKTANDNLTVSNEARDFQTVYQALSKVSDTRQDKIDTIKKQIEEGSYNISSDQISEKILKDFI